jgi:alpha 1,2-mannosyltransferase
MVRNNVIYGGSVPYRNMCRFNSGFFYRHELLQKYRYYWRVEPDIKLFCDVDYDPFLMMQDQNKVYGFTISLYEYQATIPTLWNVVKSFINANPGLVAPGNAMGFLSDDGGESYNLCHFWSNFEIADLDFWRGEAYSKFFEYLDEQGGFYYERWGDAPVHSIGAALFAKKEQIHFFNDIGYRHEPFQHCPQGDLNAKGKCWCDPGQNFDYEWYSCLNRYDKIFS